VVQTPAHVLKDAMNTVDSATITAASIVGFTADDVTPGTSDSMPFRQRPAILLLTKSTMLPAVSRVWD
jgi:hypothetical protein